MKKTISILLAKRYVNALYQAAGEKASELQDYLRKLNDYYENDSTLYLIQILPNISSMKKKVYLEELAESLSLPILLKRFLLLLLSHRRLDLLPQITIQYDLLHLEMQSLLPSTIYIPSKTSKEQIIKIQEYIAKQYKQKLHWKIIYTDDIKLGFIVKVGDEHWDGSMKKQLNYLQKKLLC